MGRTPYMSVSLCALAGRIGGEMADWWGDFDDGGITLLRREGHKVGREN